ncbi:MAG: TonB-dependent receptor [Bacteroidia bacterium]|nr:TonB-dependent receptor [Bacteroidia bacterium]
MGYNEVEISNIPLYSGKELIVNIEMEEKVITSKEVVVIANQNKAETQNKLATVSSRGFTVEETQRYAGSRSDVGRMAANYAGVNGMSDSRNDIIIRGNSPIGLLWRLEGVDIFNPNHYASSAGTTGGPVCMLNNNLMSNSDFMTGAFPAEYGNAVSGVFDLKMRSGNNEKYEFTGQIGYNGFELGAEGPIMKSNGSSFLVSYRYSTLEVMSMTGVDFGTGTAIPKYQDLSFKINFPKTKLGSFSLFGLGGISKISLLDSKDTANTKTKLYNFGEAMDLVNGSDMGVAGLNHTYFINNTTYTKLTVAISGHITSTTIDTINPANWNTSPFYRSYFTETKIFSSLSLNKKINSQHSFKAGILFSRLGFDMVDSVNRNTGGRFLISTDFNGYTELYQPFAQWQYKITENLIFNPGLHFEYFALNKSYSFEPRVGLKWNFTPLQSVSFGYGYHSQINPITVYFRQTLLPDNITYRKNNEGLDMLHSQHFILGYDWIIRENVRLKAETYLQLISNAPVDGSHNTPYSMLNQGADFVVWAVDTLVNKGEGRNYGLELTLERFLSSGMYYLGTLSLYDSKYKGSDGVEHNTVYNGGYVVNLLFGKEFYIGEKKTEEGKSQKILAFDIKTTAAGGQRYTPVDMVASRIEQREILFEDKMYSKQFPAYNKTDFKISFKLNKKKTTQEWAIDITNLFDQKNIYSKSFNKKTGAIDNTYQLGRMIIPQYKITF